MTPRKPRRWRKDFPYYKIQTYREVSQSWSDEPRAYANLAEVRRTIRTRFADRRARIVIVERERRRVLDT